MSRGHWEIHMNINCMGVCTYPMLAMQEDRQAQNLQAGDIPTWFQVTKLAWIWVQKLKMV